MSPEQAERKTPAKSDTESLLEKLSAAIESGAGLPAVTRAAAQALGASLALIDRSSAVLGVAASSLAHSGERERSTSSARSVDTIRATTGDAASPRRR